MSTQGRNKHKGNFQYNYENRRDHNADIIHRHMKPHTFHVVGNEFGIKYDGILGRDFF